MLPIRFRLIVPSLELGLPFFPSASWPLSFLSLFFLFLRPCYDPVQSSSCSLCVFYKTLVVGKDTYLNPTDNNNVWLKANFVLRLTWMWQLTSYDFTKIHKTHDLKRLSIVFLCRFDFYLNRDGTSFTIHKIIF